MSEKLDAVERPPVIGEAGFGDNSRFVHLSLVKGMDDKSILEAMAERLDKNPTVVDGIAGLIAEEILRQNLDQGAPLVRATWPLVMRNMHGECLLSDEDFARLRGHSRSALEEKTAQGDWGIHATAGIGINRSRLRISTASSRRGQFEGVGVNGYRQAYIAAEQARRTEPGLAVTMQATVPTLVGRFGEVVEIVSGLLQEKTVKEILNKRGLSQLL